MSQGMRTTALLPIMLVLAAAVAWQAGATSTAQRAAAQPTTVATVDIVEIFDQLTERPVLESQLQNRLKAREAQVEEIRARVRAIQEDIQTVHTPGTEAYYERVREFTEQRAVGEARVQALQQIISIDRGNIQRQLYQKIKAAIQKIAERDGIHLVHFDDSGFEIPENASNEDVMRAIVTKGVIYKHESVDITQRVITLMNNEYTAP